MVEAISGKFELCSESSLMDITGGEWNPVKALVLAGTTCIGAATLIIGVSAAPVAVGAAVFAYSVGSKALITGVVLSIVGH